MAKCKTPLMQLVELRYGQPIDQLLSRLYVDEGKTLSEIGSMIGISESGVYRWMKSFNIPRRAAEWVTPSA